MGAAQDFEREFRKAIEPLRTKVVRALKKLVQSEPPEEMEVQLFEIFPYWDKFPVRAFAYDRSASEVAFDPPFCDDVLKGVRLIPPKAIDQDAYEQKGVATLETGARLLAEWFGECWHEAGGKSFPLPAYIMYHDSPTAYALKKKAWVDSGSMWE